MRLLIVSHTPHYLRNGSVVGWGPTVREIDELARLFTEVRHVAPLHQVEPPPSAVPYHAEVRLVPVPPAGGDRLADKGGVARVAPRYLGTIRREIANCDVVHVRCPASISLFAVLLLGVVRHPEKRWIKYAGNWGGGSREPWSYKLQRRLLAGNLPRALVTVNGEWPGQPEHVRPFLNPCLTEDELRDGRESAIGKSLASPVRLLFVGRLDEAKGAGRVLEILSLLHRRGVPARARLVGEGPRRAELERRAAELPEAASALFLGSVARASMASLYAESDILLLPSGSSEGWPKVLSEGMAYGVVPLASDVSCIPQYLRTFSVGRAMPFDDVPAFADAVAGYSARPAVWKAESQRCVESAPLFSYQNYLISVRALLGLDGEGVERGA